jgi:hypothetical protein
MGAWGTAIFSNDTACDVRDTYRGLLEDGVSDADAMSRVITEFADLDPDEAHELWLALAAIQTQLGRLDDTVRDRALAIIDSGQGLELWAEAGTRELAARKTAYAKLQTKLTGPQPSSKKVRRSWRHVTDLKQGDVLARTHDDGSVALFRVAKIETSRVQVAPILERLEWHGPGLPTDRQVESLAPAKIRDRENSFRDGKVDTYSPNIFGKSYPDWRDVGFVLIGTTRPRPRDDRAFPLTSMPWDHLAAKTWSAE